MRECFAGGRLGWESRWRLNLEDLWFPWGFATLAARLVWAPDYYVLKFPDIPGYYGRLAPDPAFLPELRWVGVFFGDGGLPFPYGEDVEPDR